MWSAWRVKSLNTSSTSSRTMGSRPLVASSSSKAVWPRGRGRGDGQLHLHPPGELLELLVLGQGEPGQVLLIEPLVPPGVGEGHELARLPGVMTSGRQASSSTTPMSCLVWRNSGLWLSTPSRETCPRPGKWRS